MKCLKCGKIIEDNVKECPYCGNEIDNLELDLPILKDNSDEKIQKKEESLSKPSKSKKKNKIVIEVDDNYKFERTMPLDEDKDDNKESLDIDTQDDLKVNSLSQSEINNNEKEELGNEEKITIASQESIQKRKKILLVISSIFLIFALVFCTIIFVLSQNHKATESKDYNVRLQEALQNYYESENIDDLVYLLEENKNNPEIIENIQLKTRDTCDSWITSYIDSEPNNANEFKDITNKYKSLISNLNEYAKITVDDKEIKYLEDNKSEELLAKIDNIYNDSSDYIKALSLYKTNDYNKAYNIFKNIEQNNSFYNKANDYMSKINKSILELLKKDIEKLEYSIDSLSESGKAIRYRQIVFIINEYNSVYSTLNLTSNSEYQKILNEYKDKYSKYHTESNTLGDTDINLDDMGNT